MVNYECVAGIDYGLNGGYAIFNREGLEKFDTFPKLGKLLDYTKLESDIRCILNGRSTVVFAEKLFGRPGQSSSATFSFGFNVGRAYGLVCDTLKLPLIEITPQRWQKCAHQGVKMASDPKARSLEAATKLFPGVSFLATERSRVPHDGIIDATLIAWYGRNFHNDIGASK